MCSTWPPCPLKWAAYGMKSNDLRWFSGAQENQRKWKHWRILLHLPLEPTLSQYYLSKKIFCIFRALVFTRAAWFHWPTWNQLQVDSPAAQHLQHSQRCSVIWLRPWRWMATYLLRSADGILLLPSLQGWRTIKSCWKSQGELENEDGKYMTLPLIGFILKILHIPMQCVSTSSAWLKMAEEGCNRCRLLGHDHSSITHWHH